MPIFSWVLDLYFPNNFPVKNARGTLYDFYQDYYNWVELGAPSRTIFGTEPIFVRYAGLCQNHHRWARYHEIHAIISSQQADIMKQHFIQEMLNPVYPFGEQSFHIEGINSTMHRNQKRLAFVERRLTHN